MTKLETLFCPMCSLATMRKHPSANPFKETKFNDTYKCNFCGFTIDLTKHEENVEKMSSPELGKGKKYFQRR